MTAAVDAPEVSDKTRPPQIPRERVEEYLARHRRDAASLLAAFHALQDTNLLLEAATNFPNDPQLQWTIVAEDAFPQDRRKWLDAFKTSSPSNSLANYLSAQDDFKNQQPEAAMKEMTAAAGKSQFADYSMEYDFGRRRLCTGSVEVPAQTLTRAPRQPCPTICINWANSKTSPSRLRTCSTNMQVQAMPHQFNHWRKWGSTSETRLPRVTTANL